MLMKILLTPITNFKDGYVLDESSEHIFYKTFEWEEEILVYDFEVEAPTLIEAKDISRYRHHLIIKGEQHFIVHAFSKAHERF